MAQSKEVAEKKNSALALDLSVLEGDAGGRYGEHHTR